MISAIYDSPVGPLTLASNGVALTQVSVRRSRNAGILPFADRPGGLTANANAHRRLFWRRRHGLFCGIWWRDRFFRWGGCCGPSCYAKSPAVA
jgi:hypothetical protein